MAQAFTVLYNIKKKNVIKILFWLNRDDNISLLYIKPIFKSYIAKHYSQLQVVKSIHILNNSWQIQPIFCFTQLRSINILILA